MFDCQDCENEGDANCKHCQTSGDNQLYWGIQLDQDLLETIVSIYPEWFKDYNMNLASTSDGESEQGKAVIPLTCTKISFCTPKSEVEDASLQKTMDRNKESLKVKLMLRRPINQLVDQGILPSLKSPPAFHEQRQKLERAKMGDLLKSKIQRRPDRQELIQQHILEDTTVDPSLQDKRRQLKRACLADGLNDRISHRPGPLDLVKGNILHTDEIVAQGIREGSVHFKSTNEVPSPRMKISIEDDSGSDGAFSPSPPYDFNEHSQSSLPSLETNESSPYPFNQGSPCSVKTSFSMSPPSSVSSPLSVMPAVASPHSHDHVPDLIINGLLLHNKESPAKNRKKTKPKTQPKAKTIKFHEYKGPPSAQKPVPVITTPPSETSYEMLLRQQQLFLQWQLEWQQRHSHSVFPPTQNINGDQTGQANQTTSPTSQTTQLFESPASPQKLLSKLEDLKVSDLKAELKKRNLPVSGSKPLLIERLKSYSELPQNIPTSTINLHLSKNIISNANTAPIPINVGGILLDTLPTIPAQSSNELSPRTPLSVREATSNSCSNGASENTMTNLINALSTGSQPTALSHPMPAMPMDLQEAMDTSDSSSGSVNNDELVHIQQRCIQNLQRELQRSQMQLQQSIICQPPSAQEPSITAVEKLCSPISDSPDTATTISSTVPSVATSDATSSVPTCASTQGLAADKIMQRQLIHQYLQQKIQQQQLQLQQKQLQEMQLQQQQQQQHGKLRESLPTSSTTNANSTLTALLESQPLHPLPVSISLNTIEDTPSTTMAIASFQTSVMTTQILNNKSSTCNMSAKAFPGVIPLFVCQTTSPANHTATTVPSITKSAAISLPNGIANHRTSSLPSFSDLLSSKPTPTRSNTDPQFLLTRPPPDYNEATRQLNKVKQHYLQSGSSDGNPRQTKKHKSSIKCQAVDDVLEILIKNGELPPSAAQEPPTPTTPITPKSEHSAPLFSARANSCSTAATLPTNVASTSLLSAPISSSCESESNTNLHIASLQSVLDMTPPSSAGFGEPSNTTSHSLDFDFHLDVEDIEAMDLDGLTHEEQTNPCSRPDPSLPVHLPKETKNISVEPNQFLGINGNSLRYSELTELHDRGMDMDLLEWLEVLGETSGVSSNASSNIHHPTYSIANENDPMLSNLSSTHDTLDLFSVDEMDFKPNDLSLLAWDKADFAT